MRGLSLLLLVLFTSSTCAKDDDFKEFKGHEGHGRIGLITPDGKTLVSCSGWPSGDGTVRVFEFATGKTIHVLKGHKKNINCMAMSPDGKYVYSGGGNEDGFCRGWDVKTGKEVVTFEGHTKGLNVSCILVSPDGKMVASGGSGKKLLLWDSKTGKEIRKLDGHSDLVRCLAFTPDGKKLISGSWDGSCKVWDVEKGKEILSFKPKTKWVEGLAMMPDGKSVIVGCDEWCQWNIETGKKIKTFNYSARCVAVSPDGKHMVGGFFDGKVHFVEIESGKRIDEYQASDGHIHGVAFSADGKWFTTAGGGGYKDNKEVIGTDFIIRAWPVEK